MDWITTVKKGGFQGSNKLGSITTLAFDSHFILNNRLAETTDYRRGDRAGIRSSCCTRSNAWRMVALRMRLSPLTNGFLVDFGQISGEGIGVGFEEVGVVVVVGGVLLLVDSLLPTFVMGCK